VITKKVLLERIMLEESTSVRASIDTTVVGNYRRAMEAGDDFPPVALFESEEGFYIGDGFLRILAAGLAGHSEVLAHVYEGGPRDALLHACGANAEHGKPMTSEDKRLVVTRVLEDEKQAQWSDRQIARWCGVSNAFVGKMRRELAGSAQAPRGQEVRKYRTKHGTVSTMKIGKLRGQHDLQEPDESR
jgi:hypothetical protein